MKFTYILLTLLISLSGFGQGQFLEKKGSKFTFQGETYACSELEDVYKFHEQSLTTYLSGRNLVKTSNVMAYGGLLLIVFGSIGMVATDDLNAAALGALVGATGVIIELVALFPRAIGNAKLKKARKDFNFEMIKRHGYQDNISLSCGVTSRGIGLVFSF